MSYEVRLIDSSNALVGSPVTNTDAFTFELIDACLPSNGLGVNRASDTLIPWPSNYYYDGYVLTSDGTPTVYGANVFSTSNSACPVVSYACERLDPGDYSVIGGCSYSTTDTELAFDTSTGEFTFRSSDISDAQYPPGSYLFKITA